MIARTDHASGDGVTTVIVEVRDDRFPDVVGVGEGYPDRFYGETPDTMAAIFPYLLSLADDFALGLGDVASARRQLAAVTGAWGKSLRWNGGAKCALDIALHDFAGKVLGIPVYELIGLPAEIPPTDFTIGIDEPAIVAQRAARAADFPALKIKCGGPQDLETLRAVREVFTGPIRIDANTGWTRDDAERLLPEIIALGVELIEQPFPARAYRDLGWLQERSSIPIVADESAVTDEDLDALVGVVGGVNVKLAKCGGIGPAKAMLERAHELGFKTVPRLHGGDVGRDRRIGGRRLTRRLDRPRRLPPAGRRPVRGPRPGRRTSLDPDPPARSRAHLADHLTGATLVPYRRSVNARSCG